MKVTKFHHSCLVIEDNNRTILIDPGSYSNPDIAGLNNLDYLLITHDHQDHMHLPLIKEVLKKFPNAKIIGPKTVKAALEKEGLTVLTEEESDISITSAPHHKFLSHQTENYLFTVFGKLSHPGDSFEFNKTAETLALPFTAPWGSTQEALELALSLKPETIIPIHDFMLKDESRIRMYDIARRFLESQGIIFIPIKDGEPVEL